MKRTVLDRLNVDMDASSSRLSRGNWEIMISETGAVPVERVSW